MDELISRKEVLYALSYETSLSGIELKEALEVVEEIPTRYTVAIEIGKDVSILKRGA